MAVIPVLLTIFTMDSVHTALGCFFVLGVAFSGITVVNYLYFMEFITTRHRSNIYTVGNTMGKLVVLAVVIYFRFVSRSWEYWFYMIFCMQLFVICG